MVEPGSEVHTDGWRGYNGLATLAWISTEKDSPNTGSQAERSSA
jgi:hypothetical protein